MEFLQNESEERATLFRITLGSIQSSKKEHGLSFGIICDLSFKTVIFRTPAYYNQQITQPVPVEIRLIRKSDGSRSDPVYFTYKPKVRGNLKDIIGIYFPRYLFIM